MVAPMARADFDTEGVTLHLSKEEWWFVTSAMSHVLYGDRLPDHDFQNILMSDPVEAERLQAQLSDAEVAARAAGNHWAPRPRLEIALPGTRPLMPLLGRSMAMRGRRFGTTAMMHLVSANGETPASPYLWRSVGLVVGVLLWLAVAGLALNAAITWTPVYGIPGLVVAGGALFGFRWLGRPWTQGFLWSALLAFVVMYGIIFATFSVY